MTIQLYSTSLPAMVLRDNNFLHFCIHCLFDNAIASCLFHLRSFFWYHIGVVFVKVLWTGTVFLQIPMPDVITDALTGQAEMEIFVFIAWELALMGLLMRRCR